MKQKEFKKHMLKEMITTDILHADLKIGDVSFLETAYDILGVDSKRIEETGRKCNKISPNPSDAGYETLICIVVEEICRAGNTKLQEAFIDFYLKRYPQIRDKAAICENDAEKLFHLYLEGLDKQNFKIADFQRKSFNLFYMVFISGGRTSEELARMWKEHQDKYPNSHYKKPEWRFYENLNNTKESNPWMKLFHDANLTYRGEELQKLEYFHRRHLAKYFGIESDKLERYIIRRLFLEMSDEYKECEDISWYMDCQDSYDYMNNILKRHHMSPLILKAENITEYTAMLKNIMRQMYIEVLSGFGPKFTYLANDVGDTGDELYIDQHTFLEELMTRFLFECHIDHQQKMWDEYYKHFSFAGVQGYSNLKVELSQCKKKLQKYVDAEAERKRRENKEAKKADRQYNENIALLEKKLKEYEKEVAYQKEKLADMDTYISLLESGNEPENSVENVDYSKLCSSRILFVGGLPEMISRLKSVFSTATFIDNETMSAPQKTDLIVLLTGYMNHALYYKYIGLARDKSIKMTYCNGSNIDLITKQVACCL